MDKPFRLQFENGKTLLNQAKKSKNSPRKNPGVNGNGETPKKLTEVSACLVITFKTRSISYGINECFC